MHAVFADYGVAAPQRERYRREAVRNPVCQGRLYGEARICGQVSASPLSALREGGPTSCGQNVRPPRDSRQHTYRAWAKRGESPSCFATTEWGGQDSERPARRGTPTMPTDPQTILQRIDLGKLLVTAVVV